MQKLTNHNIHEIFSSIPLISYIDENLNVVYSPSLDIYGYGVDEQEAKSSFEINLSEYIKYCTSNNSLEIDLRKNGWIIDKKKSIYTSPDLASLIEKNEAFRSIINSR